jgi:hypothetical protein
MYRTRQDARGLKPTLLACSFMLALIGCSTPETQIRSALLDAGLSQPMATCMAGRLVDRLSATQLWKLRELKQLGGKDAQNLSVRDFVNNSKSLQDPEIMSVISSSALVCAIAG